MRVFVFYNLHRHCLSVRAAQGPMANLVIAHALAVQMSNVVFKVSEAGRQRVLHEKSKNVHAGIVGELDAIEVLTWLRDVPAVPGLRAPAAKTRPATYDPYRFSSFVDRDTLEALSAASRVDVRGSDIRYAGHAACATPRKTELQ